MNHAAQSKQQQCVVGDITCSNNHELGLFMRTCGCVCSQAGLQWTVGVICCQSVSGFASPFESMLRVLRVYKVA